MNARITSRLLVGAIRRRAEAAGGQATVLAKGDETSGAVLLVLARRGKADGLVERGFGPEGDYRWMRTGPGSEEGEQGLTAYLERRRRVDPDLWIVELDLPETEDWLDEFVGAD